MKTRYLPLLIPSLLVSKLHSEEATPNINVVQPEIKPFETASMFFSRPYSSALGYSLWNSDYLFEQTFADPLFDKRAIDDVSKEADPNDKEFGYTSRLLSKIEDDADAYLKGMVQYKDGKLKVEKFAQEEYEKRMLNKRLVFATDESGKTRTDGAAVLVKLRDSFQLYNEAQPGFLLEYSGHSDNGETLRAKGAVIADIYHPWLYNRSDMFANSNLIHNPYEVVIRTGVEFDYDDAATKKDLTSYYLLANFQANPDQDWFAGPQFVQLGIAYDQDGVNDDNDFRFIAAWQPVFFLDGLIPQNGKRVGELFGINVKQYFKSIDQGILRLKSVTESIEDKVSASEDEDKPKAPSSAKGNWYTWMPLDFNFSDSSEVIESLTSDGDFGGATLGIRTGYGVGNDYHGMRLRYELNADFPLSSIEESRVSHAIIGEFAVSITNGLLTGDPKEDEPGTIHKKYGGLDTFSGMTIFAKWQTGEFDDTPGSHSEWSVGTRWRF